MNTGYFHRLHAQTPTQFWINNPSRGEADKALATGALGVTNNPSYPWKMLEHPDEASHARNLLKRAVAGSASDSRAVAQFQRDLVLPVAEKFLPLWESSRGKHGWVSIQGDPLEEHHAEAVVEDARANRKLAPNICCKIPVTKAGLKAIETLVPEGTPINATEIMSVAQGIALCEAYEKAAVSSGKRPPLYLSYIAGIYDDHLRNCVARDGIDISRDVLNQAGLAGARKMYRIVKERGWSAVMIGGGARALRHFTEMVGGELVVTINWKGTADALLAEDPDVVFRFFNPVPDTVTDELLAKLPDFRRGWEPGGLSVEEFEGFGPVVLFRDSFVSAWKNALGAAAETRKAAGA